MAFPRWVAYVPADVPFVQIDGWDVAMLAAVKKSQRNEQRRK
jgi:hypothetical protein